MIDREQMEHWDNEYGEEAYCPLCEKTIPARFMCDDETYCDYFHSGNEDYNEEGETE